MFGSDNESAILRGDAARLGGIRAALSSSVAAANNVGASLVAAALEPFLQSTQQEEQQDNREGSSFNIEANAPLYQEHVLLSWQMEDDNDDGDRRESCPGYLVVTHEACLFCATTPNNNNINNNNEEGNLAENDWYVPATRITLHALTGDENEQQGGGAAATGGGVYLQMEQAHDEECSPIEWTVTTMSKDAPALYAAVSTLVSLHPIDPHHDTNGMQDDDEDDEHFEPEDMIWASDIRNDDDDDDDGDNEGATEEERQAMLDRLDGVLTVPPEYEIKDDAIVLEEATEGQFDDADEEERRGQHR